MVIGGGLTSAHIVSTALSLGASHVAWVMRKHLQVRWQSTNPLCSLWLIPHTHSPNLNTPSPPAEAVRCGGCGESGGPLLPRGARHQAGWTGLPQAVLQPEQPPQTPGHDSPSQKGRGRHPRGLRPPAALHTEWACHHQSLLSGLFTLGCVFCFTRFKMHLIYLSSSSQTRHTI